MSGHFCSRMNGASFSQKKKSRDGTKDKELLKTVRETHPPDTKTVSLHEMPLGNLAGVSLLAAEPGEGLAAR